MTKAFWQQGETLTYDQEIVFELIAREYYPTDKKLEFIPGKTKFTHVTLLNYSLTLLYSKYFKIKETK